jgi:hypothetical protein
MIDFRIQTSFHEHPSDRFIAVETSAMHGASRSSKKVGFRLCEAVSYHFGTIAGTGFTDFEAPLLVQSHPSHVRPAYFLRKKPEPWEAADGPVEHLVPVAGTGSSEGLYDRRIAAQSYESVQGNVGLHL